MKVFIEFPVKTSFIIEKEVPDGSSHDDIVNSVSYDDLGGGLYLEPNVEWDHIKYALRCETPNVFKSDEHGECSYEDLED